MKPAIDKFCPEKMHTFCSVDLPYMCSLNQSDVVNNCNKFIFMQMLKRKDEAFFVYMRSGRTGAEGAKGGSRSIECFFDREEAIKYFTAIFRDKTGIAWSERQTDTDFHKGKYQYVYMKYEDSKVKKVKEDAMLEPEIMWLMKLIYDKDLYTTAADQYKINSRKLPLGSLAMRQLERARAILTKLSVLIASSEDCTEEILELSSQYYSVIPTTMSKLKPIDSKAVVTNKLDALETLENLCYMGRNVDLDKFTQYSKLECKLTHVTDSRTKMLIERYFSRNKGATHQHHYRLKIHDIYAIDKPMERARYAKWDGLHNKQLLWHGTRLANAVGILTNGFKIFTSSGECAAISGKMFGNGIYFANISTKSAGYMGAASGSYGIMFLCEVALGNVYDRTYAENIRQLPAGKHSVRGVGQYQPDESDHVEHEGYTIPIGEPQHSPSNLYYDEYIVYNVSQIRMRYMVVFKVG